MPMIKLKIGSPGCWARGVLLWASLIVTPVAGADEVMADMDSISTEVVIKSHRSWNGSQLPPYGVGQPEVSVVRVTIPAGVSLPVHVHPHATVGVLTQGNLRVSTQEGVSADFKAGDAVLEVINQPHWGMNIGQEDAVILVVYAGIQGEPVTRLIEE